MPVEIFHVVNNHLQVLQTVTGQNCEELVRSPPGAVAFALRGVFASMRYLEEAVMHKVLRQLLSYRLFALREALQQLSKDAEVAPEKNILVL